MPEQADDGIVLTNTRGVILDANARACQMLGYTREELLYSNAVRLLHPDDLRYNPLPLEGLVFGSTLVHERRMRRKDGTFIEVEGRRRSLQGSKSILILRDIAQRKHAEAQAKEWEDRFEAAVAASGKVLYELDVKSNEMVWAGAAASSLGAAIAVLPNRHSRWLALVHPDDRRAVAAEIERVRQGLCRLRIEYRVLRKDGAYIHVRDEGCFHGGVRERVVGFIEDITEAKLAAEELKRSEEALRAAAKLAGLIVWDWDLSTGRIKCSEDAEAALGFPKGSLSKNKDTLFWAIHPDDRAKVREAMTRAADALVEPDLIVRLVRDDTSIVTVRCAGRLFRDSAGNPKRMAGMLIKITTTGGS